MALQHAIPMQAPEFRYRAFLSYRTADRRIAEKLHRALESYAIPRSLVGRTTTLGVVGKKVGPIFRDRDDARTEEDIETIIAQELSKSQHLIVVCTPRTREAGSWVSREIELFRARRPGGKVHAVIGDGEPPDCFPHPLLATGAGNRVGAPLAADIRPRGKGGQDGFDRAVIKIVAGLTGLDFDDLWQRARRRRLRQRVVIAAVASFAVLSVTVAYAYAELSRFVREEGERLVVYKGRVGLNPPGYPQSLWTLSTTTGRLQLLPGTDPKSFVVAAAPGENVLAKLDALTRPDYRATAALDKGDRTAARDIARKLVMDATTNTEQRLYAKFVFAEAADPADVPDLRDMLADERRDVRLAVARALFRMDAEAALAGDMLPRPAELEGLDRDLVRLVQPPCGSGVRAFLEATFRTTSNVPGNSELIDAALRADCRLSVSSLVVGLRRPSLFGDRSIALYATLTGQAGTLADDIFAEFSRADLDEWRRGGLVDALRHLDAAPCRIEVLSLGLAARIRLSRLQTMAAIARLCPEHTLELSRLGSASLLVVLRRAASPTLEERIDMADPSMSIEARYLADLVSTIRPADAPAMLRLFLAHAGDDAVRTSIIRSLTTIGDRNPLPEALLSTNNLDIRKAAIEHERARDEAVVVAKLMRQIGSSDLFFVGQLGRISLPKDRLLALKPLLAGGREHRGQAACLLAMQASVDEVATLLTSPDADIRERAAACAPFNAAALKIVDALPREVGGFPLPHYSALRNQVMQRRRLEEQLSLLMPHQRLERLRALDTTSGGFGHWQEGMRYWIEEQRYQLARLEAQK